MSATSRVVERCQVCDASDLEPVLFLGYLPPVNQMVPVGTPPSEQAAYPAQLLRCARCTLVQLGLVVDPRVLFPPEYPYRSGTTAVLRENFAELYAECMRLVPLRRDDLVVDVGSNDGTLLANFASRHRVHGIEPTDMGQLAVARGIPTLQAFFDAAAVEGVRSAQGPARVVTAANVFAHIDRVHDVVENVAALLSADGVFVTESHYLLSLVETLQYDTIYHEHLRYYSLRSLAYLLDQHGFRVFHARRIPTHGGSIRVYAARGDTQPVRESVATLLAEEEALASDGLPRFRSRVGLAKLELHALLLALKREGRRIYGVGAPSRASTLIRYTGLDDGVLECVLEVEGSHKIGKYMPGTVIPVMEERRLLDDPPDCALLLSWHIAEELAPKLRRNGYRGEFLVPLPEPRLIEVP